MNPSKHFSSVVTSLRFPLILLVILIHTQPVPTESLGDDYSLYVYVGTLIKWLFTRVADLDLPLRDQEASMDAHRPLPDMEPHLHPYLHSERVSGILCRTS